MKVFQTKPLLWFSAISMVMPRSMPSTSASYQPVRGLKASTNPYFFHTLSLYGPRRFRKTRTQSSKRSEEHTSELQSRGHLVCRLLLEKKKKTTKDKKTQRQNKQHRHKKKNIRVHNYKQEQ